MAQHNGSPPAMPALEELSGTVLDGRYALGRVLGAGGMGAVFEAEDQRLSRPVAIKVMRPVFAGHDEYIKRFLREAQSASKVRHRNVVVVLDYGEAEGGLVYSVMEFLVGEDLEHRLRNAPQNRLPWHQTCGLLMQIASGLRAAHSKGVIHRDIKPANCFITEEDDELVVKLVDFGIAKLDNATQTQQLTGTAQVLGTPSYIAPDLMQTTSPASPRSDVYSLGVVAYRMLAGVLPFTAQTAFEVMRRACMDPVPPLRDRLPDLPEGVEALVLEMLAKQPDDRPSDMGEVRQRLRALSQQTLGAQAVQIPESSALPLSVDDSLPPPGSTDVTTVPREVARGVTDRPQARDVGVTAVVLEPVPESDQRRPPRPPDAPPPVIVAPVGAPQEPVYDPTSGGSRSGETLPAVGESTLRMGDSGAVEKPVRRRTGGLVLGVAAGLLALGGVAASIALLDDDGSEAREGATVAKAEGVRTEEAKGSPAPTAEVGAASPPEESASVPGGALSADVSGRQPAVEPEPAPPSEPDPTQEEKPEPPPDPEPDPEPVAEPPAAKPKPASQPTKDVVPKKPAGPPSDGTLKKRLKRKVKSKCGSKLASRRVTVSFIVTKSGGIDFLTATLKDAAGECAKKQVQGTKFRPRDQGTPFKIVVE